MASEYGTARDSVGNTLKVAVSLSIVCSLLVASTAVLLKPKQIENAERYRQSIILDVAGLLGPGSDVDALFAGIEVRMVDLAHGSYDESIDPQTFDVRRAAKDPRFEVSIPPALDIAGIGRRSRYAPVYILRSNGAIDQVILPVHGAGLWSTMYGYLAVAGDGDTIRGIRFYEHEETPGLGDRIDDPDWRAQWSGKTLYGPDRAPQIEVVRGNVRPGDDARYQVDGISGATLTGRGVTNLVRYWSGAHGYGPYLDRLKEEFHGNE